MNYGTIKPVDIVDGIGCRVGLYVSGCTRHCQGCHNPEAWDFGYGKRFTTDTINEILSLLNKPYIKGLSILGGEPLHSSNIIDVMVLCKKVREKLPEKTIWLYTGYVWEEVKNLPIMEDIDVLVDGEYIESHRDLTLRFRGSSNQRIIDVPKSLKSMSVVLWKDGWKEARL